ncbi:MAG: RNA-binding cell elongation regulator Jag/EloR [Desulfobacterales bacterium]
MSSFREFEGKNVESAVKVACEQLGMEKKNLKIEIISHGSTGIFGLVGARKARVRVCPAQPTTRQEEDTVDSVETQEAQTEKEGDSGSRLLAEKGKAIIYKLIRPISPESSVSAEINKTFICFKITGGDPAMLIGKRGQTLDAIQYLAEKIISKHMDERVRVQIDVEGYLEQRKADLQELAGRISEKVKRTGKPATVGHMTAHDRRIIHLTLKNDKYVRTQSLGDGFLRKIVIFPKRRMNKEKKTET